MSKKHYIIVGGADGLVRTKDPLTKDEFLDLLDEKALDYGLTMFEYNTSRRPELLGEPRFVNLAGPMYDGERDGVPVIRYETWEAYRILST